MSDRLVVVHPDAEVLAQATASRLLTRLLDLQSVRRPIHLGLTGGTVGIATLAALAEHPALGAVDWSGVHLWWGDERFLPAGDPDRNETQARAALIARIAALPAENVHPIPSSTTAETPEKSAAAYAAEMARLAGGGLLAFDVLLFGMGPDGHVASLFPGFPQLEVVGETAAGVRDSPKPPPLRVTLTFAAIHAAREVWVVAAGAEKADAAALALAGADRKSTPASDAVGAERTLWLLDAAAAGAVA